MVLALCNCKSHSLLVHGAVKSLPLRVFELPHPFTVGSSVCAINLKVQRIKKRTFSMHVLY